MTDEQDGKTMPLTTPLPVVDGNAANSAADAGDAGDVKTTVLPAAVDAGQADTVALPVTTDDAATSVLPVGDSRDSGVSGDSRDAATAAMPAMRDGAGETANATTMVLTTVADTSSTAVMDAIDADGTADPGEKARTEDDPLHLSDVADIEPIEATRATYVGGVASGAAANANDVRGDGEFATAASGDSAANGASSASESEAIGVEDGADGWNRRVAVNGASSIPLYTAARSGGDSAQHKSRDAEAAKVSGEMPGTSDTGGATGDTVGSGVGGPSQSPSDGHPSVPMFGGPVSPAAPGASDASEVVRKTGPSAATVTLGVCVLALGVVSVLLGAYFPLGWIVQSWALDPRIAAAIMFAGFGGVLVAVAVIWSLAKMLHSRKQGNKAHTAQ